MQHRQQLSEPAGIYILTQQTMTVNMAVNTGLRVSMAMFGLAASAFRLLLITMALFRALRLQERYAAGYVADTVSGWSW